LSAQGLLVKPYHREVLTGLALAIPLLHALSQRQFPPVWQRLDNRLGDLSYGIFLNHFLVIWVFDLGQPQQTWAWALLIGTSVLLSALSQHLIERPVLLWRRNWRVARAGKQGK
jgi:peptidoglycan/LPS O-acetylase OafA/YrhL